MQESISENFKKETDLINELVVKRARAMQNKEDTSSISDSIMQKYAELENAWKNGGLETEKEPETIEKQPVPLVEQELDENSNISNENDVLETKVAKEEPFTETEQEETRASDDSSDDEIMEEDETITKYYTMASREVFKSTMSEEIVDIFADKLPDKFYYAIQCIDDTDENGDSIQRITVLQGKDDNRDYYPALENAKTEDERKMILSEFVKKNYPNSTFYYMRFKDLFVDED